MELTNLLDQLVTTAVQLLVVAATGYAFYITLQSLKTGTGNRMVSVTNLIALVIVLGAAVVLLQFYPVLLLDSFRIGLENSRPKAQMLNDEILHWIPESAGGLNPGAEPTTTAMATTEPTPTAEPTLEATVPQLTIETVATQTPIIVTATSHPLPTAEPTIDFELWNPQTPPPTPIPGS